VRQFQTPIRFSALKQWLTWNMKLKKHLIELDVRTALVVYFSQGSEELRLYNLI
jgi:hypothetical protein